MFEWQEQSTLNFPIEQVWSLMTLETLNSLFPGEQPFEIIKGSRGEVGCTYQKTISKRGHTVLCTATDVAYEDTPQQKEQTIDLVLDKHATGSITIELADTVAGATLLTYSGSIKGTSILAKAAIKTNKKRLTQLLQKDFITLIENKLSA